MSDSSKLLTVVIPCYNSEKFLDYSLGSLLFGLEDKLDIIIVNDGSKDKTSEIAHQYEKKYPNSIRVVDKENGGHGSGGNVGLKLAKGLYFKILDSDDAFDREGFIHLLNKIEQQKQIGDLPDIFVADYLSVYANNLPTLRITFNKRCKKLDQVISFKDVKKSKLDEYVMIHMFVANTEVLKQKNFKFLEHTFYEDEQFDISILMLSDTIFYLSKPLYLYTLGREGQSVSVASLDKHFDNEINVLTNIAKTTSYDELKGFIKNKRRFIKHELFALNILLVYVTYITPSKDKHRSYNGYLKTMKKDNPRLYKMLKYRTPMFFLWILTYSFRKIALKIGFKVFGKKTGWDF